MLYAMVEASYPASCYKVYFTKNAANTKDSTNSPFGKFLAKQIMTIQNFLNRYFNYISFSQHNHTSIKIK
jgi:hypothetical protein